MSIIERVGFEPMVGDPDDHRPDTEWALVVDPHRSDGPYVEDVVLLLERAAPGDRIPLHTHTTSEAVVIQDGRADYVLGDERRTIGPGACVFIPAGVPHGLVNVGDGPLILVAFVPSAVLDITYLDRNPAPGTEGQPPQPPIEIDPRR